MESASSPPVWTAVHPERGVQTVKRAVEKFRAVGDDKISPDGPVTQWAVGLAFIIAFGPVNPFRRIGIGGTHQCRGPKRQRQQDGSGFHVCPDDSCDFAANPPARQFLPGQIRSRTSCYELCW